RWHGRHDSRNHRVAARHYRIRNGFPEVKQIDSAVGVSVVGHNGRSFTAVVSDGEVAFVRTGPGRHHEYIFENLMLNGGLHWLQQSDFACHGRRSEAEG